MLIKNPNTGEFIPTPYLQKVTADMNARIDTMQGEVVKTQEQVAVTQKAVDDLIMGV